MLADWLTGYLIAQYPAGYLLQRLPIGKFVGATIVGWGTLIITTPACTNFAGIAANRFLLGMTEAVVNPSFVLVMAMWYQSVRNRASVRLNRVLMVSFVLPGRTTSPARHVLLHERRRWHLRWFARLCHRETLMSQIPWPCLLTVRRVTSPQAWSNGVRALRSE